MPKGDVARKLNHEESEEIHLLREQVRDLSEMNLALRRELQAMQVHRERRISTSSWESSEADIEIDEDVVDPSQVHPRTGRVSVRAGRASVREEEDDEGLLEEEPVSPNAINLKADNDDGDGVPWQASMEKLQSQVHLEKLGRCVSASSQLHSSL